MPTSTMTPRERIVAAIRYEPCDVLPIDFGGMRSTGIAAIAYNKLKAHLGLGGPPAKLYDVFQQLAEPEESVLQRMGGDVMQVHRYEPAFGINIAAWKPDTLPDGSPCLAPAGLNPRLNARGDREIVDPQTGIVIAVMPAGSLYYNLVHHPLEHATRTADIDAYAFPQLTETELEFLTAQAKRLYETTDYALLASFGGNILEAGQSYFGYEKFMFHMAANPELIEYFLEKLTDSYMRDLERYLAAIGPYIQVIQLGDDLGTQRGLQLSLGMYRSLIKPYQARQYRYIREHSACAVFLHCCGGVFDLIPDLIDAGVQILNPVQITATGMDPVRLKQTYGRDLCFWGGGARMQSTVLEGDVAAIRREVRELIDIFAPGSGYVFNQVHNIQANVPPEKVLAIYDTALAYRAEQRAGA